MLDWLGVKHSNPAMSRDAAAIRRAVDAQVAANDTLTADLGGTATTDAAASAVAARIAAQP
jgi:3-isopropylmalate dehydrogenase